MKFKNISNRKNEKGSIMTEALIAAAIISVAMMGIAPMFAFSVKTSHLNKERSAAVQITRRVIEQIQHVGFAGALLIANSQNPSPAPELNDLQGNAYYVREADGDISNTPQPAYKLLQVQREYTFLENNPQTITDDIIQVNVRLNWPGAQGQSITMGTALSRNRIE